MRGMASTLVSRTPVAYRHVSYLYANHIVNATCAGSGFRWFIKRFATEVQAESKTEQVQIQFCVASILCTSLRSS
ncbi:unnamed protein product [Sphagnum jensenii]|uniref:Uncharacterized protein n=1 Tax=Sphagnum jensenii TaxID=128206 RepID=A0ABP1ACK8_9BRYO